MPWGILKLELGCLRREGKFVRSRPEWGRREALMAGWHATTVARAISLDLTRRK
jgi:hypothetical protein